MIRTADVVIIGGGISGCSSAYQLAKRGVKNIVVVERGFVCRGSTGACGAGVRMQWGTEMNCRLAQYSIDFYERANELLEYEGDVEFKQKGYLLISDDERELEQFKKNIAVQRALPSITSRMEYFALAMSTRVPGAAASLMYSSFAFAPFAPLREAPEQYFL